MEHGLTAWAGKSSNHRISSSFIEIHTPAGAERSSSRVKRCGWSPSLPSSIASRPTQSKPSIPVPPSCNGTFASSRCLPVGWDQAWLVDSWCVCSHRGSTRGLASSPHCSFKGVPSSSAARPSSAALVQCSLFFCCRKDPRGIPLAGGGKAGYLVAHPEAWIIAVSDEA
jgi:hypothetical protein